MRPRNVTWETHKGHIDGEAAFPIARFAKLDAGHLPQMSWDLQTTNFGRARSILAGKKECCPLEYYIMQQPRRRRAKTKIIWLKVMKLGRELNFVVGLAIVPAKSTDSDSGLARR